MRVSVKGDSPCAVALRSDLARMGPLVVVETLANFTVVIVESEIEKWPVVDGVDSETERRVVYHLGENCPMGVMLKRSGGNRRDDELVITVPASDEIRVAVCVGIRRGLAEIAQNARGTRRGIFNRKRLLWATILLTLLPKSVFAQGHQVVDFWDGLKIYHAVDASNNALRVNVVAGGAGGGIAQLQVRKSDNAWTDVGFFAGNQNVPVNCVAGCVAGGSFLDSTAFTFGVTPIALMGAVVDDTSTNTVAENSAGSPRMNTSRILYFDLSKTAANATAIKVDGSAVTQPVSGTFWQATQPVSKIETLSSASTATWTSATADNTAITLAVSSYTTALLTQIINSGSASAGAVTFEASADGGTTWLQIFAEDGSSNSPAGAVALAIAFPSQSWLFSASGWTHIRARLSPPITGTLNISFRLQASSGSFRMPYTFISATSLPLPTGAAQEHTTAVSPFAVQLTTGAAFYDAAKTGQFPAALVGGRLDVNVGNALTVTANAGTNLNTSALALDATLTNRTQKAQITDGTRDGTVKAASTLPVATDTALVVTERDAVTVTDGSGPLTVDGTVTTTPPSNASTNVAQFGGTNVSTGTGAGGAGIPRVTVSNDSQAKIWDGTNTAAVKAASTAVVAADPALVVGISPNTSLPAGANAIGIVVTLPAQLTVAQNDGACVTLTTTSATILASNSSRRAFTMFLRETATDVVFIKFGAVATTSDMVLAPGQPFSMMGGGVTYTGIIDGRSNTGSQSVCFAEF